MVLKRVSIPFRDKWSLRLIFSFFFWPLLMRSQSLSGINGLSDIKLDASAEKRLMSQSLSGINGLSDNSRTTSCIRGCSKVSIPFRDKWSLRLHEHIEKVLGLNVSQSLSGINGLSDLKGYFLKT